MVSETSKKHSSEQSLSDISFSQLAIPLLFATTTRASYHLSADVTFVLSGRSSFCSMIRSLRLQRTQRHLTRTQIDTSRQPTTHFALNCSLIISLLRQFYFHTQTQNCDRRRSITGGPNRSLVLGYSILHISQQVIIAARSFASLEYVFPAGRGR